MDLARIAIVDQKAFLVVAPGRRDLVIAHAAFPCLRLQVDTEIFGHGEFHFLQSSRLSRMSPASLMTNCQFSGTRQVK